jgi:hypothetical protein
VHPLGYALKAFSIGGRGKLLPATIANPDNLNLSAFCAQADEKTIYVTLINKENGATARDANIALMPGSSSGDGQVMFLTAPDSDLSLKTGVTLGGAEITDNADWKGKWTSLPKPSDGKFVVKLPAATAAIVKLRTK